MKSNAFPALAAVCFLLAAPARAQESCKLLQPAEIESALKEWAAGGKATKPAGAVDASSGIAFDTCKTEIARPGLGNLQITVATAKNLPADGADLVRTRNMGQAREQQWKVTGAQFEEKTIDKALCTRSGRPGVPAHAVCTIPRGKGYVEVEVIAPSQKDVPTMEAVAVLVQKANGRM